MALKLFGLDHQEAAQRYQIIKWVLAALLISGIIFMSAPCIFTPGWARAHMTREHQQKLSVAMIFFMGLISLIIQVGFIWGILKEMLGAMITYAVVVTIVLISTLAAFEILSFFMFLIPTVVIYYLIYLHMNTQSQPVVVQVYKV